MREGTRDEWAVVLTLLAPQPTIAKLSSGWRYALGQLELVPKETSRVRSSLSYVVAITHSQCRRRRNHRRSRSRWSRRIRDYKMLLVTLNSVLVRTRVRRDERDVRSATTVLEGRLDEGAALTVAAAST